MNSELSMTGMIKVLHNAQYDVILEYEKCYSYFGTPCIAKISDGYKKRFSAIDSTAELALTKCANLINKFTQYNITTPELKPMTYVYKIGNLRVKYDLDMYINDIYKIDDDGFIILEDGEKFKDILIKSSKENFNDFPCGFSYEEMMKFVKDGEELYHWNTLAPLSGSAGVVIVKDGKHLRHQTLVIS